MASSQEDLQEKAYEQLIPSFTRIIDDNQFELEFAAFPENYADIDSFAKNHQLLCFMIEFQGEDGNIHEFFPDFLIHQTESEI